MFPQGFLVSQNHPSRWIGDSKLPLSVNVCVNVCVRGALQRTGVSSCLALSVPG